MTDNDFHRELLSRVRAIANNSIDPWAIERLRVMAADIERRLGVGPKISTRNSTNGADCSRPLRVSAYSYGNSNNRSPMAAGD
jgi:hypothetical protein